MGKIITMEIPEQWMEGLDVEEKLIFQEIVLLGIFIETRSAQQVLAT